MMTRAYLAWPAAALFAVCIHAQEQKFAELGECRLESGGSIRECRVGYRVYGTLNPDRTNVILFPTWAGGTSEQLGGAITSMGLKHYAVIAVDAFANGVSSSPSNSRLQPRMKFPAITIRDMVNAQHRLLTETLGIRHVRAVVGISMGGMQTFEWMTAFPEFMDKAVAIVGSPRLAPYDLMHWQTQIDAIENDPAWKGGDYEKNPARVAEAEFGALLLTTPEHFNRTTTREQVVETLRSAKGSTAGSDANNKLRQCQAMMAMDVAKRFGGSLDAAAAAVRARVLVIAAKQDHVVTPGPALDFARRLKARTVVLEGDCGHLANNCEADKVRQAVAPFLAE